MKVIRLPPDWSLEDYEQLDPPEDMDQEELIGRYVLIYWPQFKEWYPGRVIGMQGRRHLVIYFERSNDTPEDEDETYAERLLG